MLADIEVFVLVALAVVLVSLRIYERVKRLGVKKLKLDDYLMVLAGAWFMAGTIMGYFVVPQFHGLTNSYMTPEERMALDPNSDEYHKRVFGSKFIILALILYVSNLWMIKFSLAIFYSHLAMGLMQYENRVRIVYILLGVTYIAILLSMLLSCRPMHRFWQINPNPGNFCQATVSKVYVLVVAVFSVFTDILLLSIPLPLLWKVDIGLKKKISLMFLFSGGIFVIAAAIVRAVVILSAGPDGAIQGNYWADRETFVSIVVSNLPIIFPLIRSAASRIGLSALFSSFNHPSNRPSNSHPLSSRRASGHELRTRSTKHQHPLSIPGGTAWESDEQILVNNNHVHISSNRLDEGDRSDDSDRFRGRIAITKEVTVVQESAPLR